jgi:hypothetical protein
MAKGVCAGLGCEDVAMIGASSAGLTSGCCCSSVVERSSGSGWPSWVAAREQAALGELSRWPFASSLWGNALSTGTWERYRSSRCISLRNSTPALQFLTTTATGFSGGFQLTELHRSPACPALLPRVTLAEVLVAWPRSRCCCWRGGSIRRVAMRSARTAPLRFLLAVQKVEQLAPCLPPGEPQDYSRRTVVRLRRPRLFHAPLDGHSRAGPSGNASSRRSVCFGTGRAADAGRSAGRRVSTMDGVARIHVC